MLSFIHPTLFWRDRGEGRGGESEQKTQIKGIKCCFIKCPKEIDFSSKKRGWRNSQDYQITDGNHGDVTDFQNSYMGLMTGNI